MYNFKKKKSYGVYFAHHERHQKLNSENSSASFVEAVELDILIYALHTERHILFLLMLASRVEITNVIYANMKAKEKLGCSDDNISSLKCS